jgi:hypothetical protein
MKTEIVFHLCVESVSSSSSTKRHLLRLQHIFLSVFVLLFCFLYFPWTSHALLQNDLCFAFNCVFLFSFLFKKITIRRKYKNSVGTYSGACYSGQTITKKYIIVKKVNRIYTHHNKLQLICSLIYVETASKFSFFERNTAVCS